MCMLFGIFVHYLGDRQDARVDPCLADVRFPTGISVPSLTLWIVFSSLLCSIVIVPDFSLSHKIIEREERGCVPID
jgi:hypothetical protein